MRAVAVLTPPRMAFFVVTWHGEKWAYEQSVFRDGTAGIDLASLRVTPRTFLNAGPRRTTPLGGWGRFGWMDVGAAVAALALHPLRELPPTPGVERIELEGILVGSSQGPVAPRVEPLGLETADVPMAVTAARAAVRERGKRFVAWWIAPEHDSLCPALKAAGLVNEATTGLEAIENAMALVQAPAGGDLQIAVSPVDSYKDFTAAVSVLQDAFQVPDEMRAETRAARPRCWEEYRQPGNPMRRYVARIGNEVVGTAGATFGDAGVNLSAAAVLAHARGRGVYRALTHARWEEAVQRGTPALTVQAGRMSLPILTKLGFTPVGEVRVYVDDLEAPAANP